MIRRILTLTLLGIFLLSCGFIATPPPPITAAPPTATPSPSSTPPPATETPLPTVTPISLPKFERVLIVSFDGLRPDAIAEAEMDNVLSLMQAGAYTFGAQTIMPSVTLPAHSSMLVGTCPEKHIVRWNQYVPKNGFAMGTDIFDLAHATGMRTVMVVGKEKLRQVTEPASTDYFSFVDQTDKIIDPFTVDQLAIQQIILGFDLMLVHFPNGDLTGHDHGWMSRRQLRAYATDDESFGYILGALKKHGLYESTLIIVTSDHGGHDSTHGTDMLEDMTIPWIVSGLGIQPIQLTTRVHTTDTAATAAFALGLSIPYEWDGVPVYEAFGLPVEEREWPVCQ
jgi:hypothetical protein